MEVTCAIDDAGAGYHPAVLNSAFHDAFADIYDELYRVRGKDYAAESGQVIEAIRALRSSAESLLDIACGTGEHLRTFREHFRAEGLDRSAAMLRVARDKLPGTPLHEGDLLNARLQARFDAVTCLFSSLGYLPDEAALGQAAATMAAHLLPGGVLAAETAILPHRLRPPLPDRTECRAADGGVIVRETAAVIDGNVLRITFRFTARPDREGFPLSERHDIRIFPAHAYIGALARAGCTVIDRRPFGSGTDLILAVKHASCTTRPRY